MDGIYVPNITFGMPMIKAIRKHTTLPLDVHLMIVKPEKYIKEFIEAGADRICFHPETCDDPVAELKNISALGVKAGIAINADVPCEPYLNLLKYCDFIMLMSVQAGYGGQSFIPGTLEKIKVVNEFIKANDLDVEIEIDGGINEDNVQSVIDAGVTVIVAGSSVYKSLNPPATIEKLRGK
jgi:ribulose-phosphate 3-epimerase